MQTKVLEYAPQFVVDLLSARVVKLVDTRDLKSLARKGVPVRLRLRAPIKSVAYRNVIYFLPKIPVAQSLHKIITEYTVIVIT